MRQRAEFRRRAALRVALSVLGTSMIGAGLMVPSAWALASGLDPDPAEPSEAGSSVHGTGQLVFEGTSARDSFSIDGETQDSLTDSVTITVTCVDFACTFEGVPYWLRLVTEGTIVDSAIVVSWSQPASGTPCAADDSPDYYENQTEGIATLTAEALTATGREAPSDWIECSDTRRVTRWGSDLVLDATRVSGDPCVLDEAVCPESRAVDVAIPVDAPVAPSTPSVFSELHTPADTLAPQQVITAVLLTLVLVILLALPTALLNSASSTGAGKVAAWRASIAARRAALGSGLPTGLRQTGEKARAWWARASTAKRGLPLAVATLLVAAIMSGFVDPDFGAGASTPRVLLSIVLGFTLEVLLGWVAMLVLLPRLIAGVDARLDVRPATLLIVLGAVIVTRLTGFEPGIVFGLVAGVAVGATLATAARVRVALASLGWGYGLALLAWVTYAALEPAVLDAAAASTDGLPPLGLVLLREALAAMTMAGIAALPVALVPARGLTGHEVWLWSKPLWAGLYAVGLLSFFLVLMPMPFAWAGVEAALATWVTGYLIYAGVAVALWLAVTQPWKRDTEPQPLAPAESPAAELVE
ncbi:hypothetical protein [Microcella humidisoli]|uniref:Uncharacterized protein n=1 Tax=Microcella humidisoli TaxID=2963406 RepID=A0ABY5FWH7_9MICO|nr:hypothetical protein [Microcella humidisoli]UTT62494.1 hypothetical protein NNL39_12710 [Microcella humidisoli]